MKKTITILIIVSFFVSWAGPLSAAFAAPGGKDGATDGASHYCEISKGPCKHKEACPLKDRHANKPHGHEAAHHHGEERPGEGPSFVTSKCHVSSDTHQTSFYTIEQLFITTQLQPPVKWAVEASFFSRDEADYSDNISYPFLRPPQSS